jgi:DNA-binding SARP family transcriptional activator
LDADEFRVLGPLEVRRGGLEVDLGRPKQRAVLAVLLIEANRVVALDRLIDLLWGDEPPSRAIGALQVYISGLRRVLEPRRPARSPAEVLLTQAPGYLLRIDPCQLDASRFETLAALGHNLLTEGQPSESLRALNEALELWRGPAYADFTFEPFAQHEVARLEELRAGALEDRIAAKLVLGQHLAVIAELEALVVAHPLRERLWTQLVLALYRAQRQSEALRAYERARGVLAEELGIEPGPVLRALRDDVLQHSPALDWRPQAEQIPVGGVRDWEEPASEPLEREGHHIVGRARELRLLETLLANAVHQGGGLALVSGEPGIGKTALLEELVARAAAATFGVAWGRCHHDEGAPSFWPWVQVIRTLLRETPPEVVEAALGRDAGEIAQIVPEVKDLVTVIEAPAALDPANARFRLFGSVCDLLAALARHRPLVLVLDDLHWADVPSLRLTEHAAERLRHARVVIVAAYRDVDPAVAPQLAETLGALARHPHVHRVPLGGLTEDEVAVFIARTAGADPSPEVAAEVHARTDGNPFFVGELARLLAGDHALGSPAALGGQVPAGVRDVIRRRLSRLPERTNDLLALASVLGRDLDLRLLVAASGVDEEEVVESIDASIAVGILVDDLAKSGGLRFSHALVQETISAELGTARRAHLHARAAEVLRQLYGDDESRAAELANHLYHATAVLGPDPACEQALRAAEVAQRRLAYEQAEWQLRRALELASTLPAGRERAGRELDVQHRLAALLSVTTGYHSEAVAEAWERARELSQGLGDTPEVLSSLWGLARLTRSRGQFEVSNELGRELLELAERSTEGFALAGHETCGLAAFFTGDPVAAAEHLRQALALSEDLGAAPGTGPLVLHPSVSCRAYLACANWILGDDQTPDELLDAARSLARRRGHPLDEAVALLYSAKLATMREDVEQTRVWCDGVRRVAATTAIGPLEAVGRILECWADARTGWSGWEAGLSRALAQLQATGWRLAWTYFLALRADAARITGDLSQAVATVEQAFAAADATGEHYYEAELRRIQGETAAATGPGGRDEAEASFRAAVEVATRQGAVAFRRRAEESLACLLGR